MQLLTAPLHRRLQGSAQIREWTSRVTQALEYADIEKARRVVKDHRCALVSDREFIMAN